MAELIDVLIVDDHPLVSEGLRAAVDADPDLRVVAVASSLSEARRALERLHPRVAVIDIRLGDGSGLELIDPDSATASILLSSFDTPQYIDAARRLGAAGFFLKSGPTDALLAGIKQVAAGDLAFAPEVVRHEAVSGRWRPLSERERDVVRLLLEGRSNDEIARGLGLARKTVESHLAHLYERCGCASRTELAVRAEREGWLDLPPR
jgi:DNA-binding NarL/FixJ family response regulator